MPNMRLCLHGLGMLNLGLGLAAGAVWMCAQVSPDIHAVFDTNGITMGRGAAVNLAFAVCFFAAQLIVTHRAPAR